MTIPPEDPQAGTPPGLGLDAAVTSPAVLPDAAAPARPGGAAGAPSLQSPVQEASRPPTSPLTPLREGCGDGWAREEAPGVLRPAGASPALVTPRAARPHAAARGGKPHPLAAAMSEDDLEEQIRDACTKLGIVRFHVRISRGTTPGLPDDILIGPEGILWRENKRQDGKPTPAQVKTGEALTAIGQDFAIWRPEDWLSGRITRELMAISGIGRTPLGDAA